MEKNSEFSVQIDQNQLRDLKDPFNSNVEVFVTFKDGLTVTLKMMAKDRVNFYGPGLCLIKLVIHCFKHIVNRENCFLNVHLVSTGTHMFSH